MSTLITLKRSSLGRQSGFTLIEILFAFTLISIISVISLPFYQNYQVRTKVSGEFSIMRPLMTRVVESRMINNDWPASNADARALEPEQYAGKYLLSAQIGSDPQAATMTLTYDVEELPVLRGTNTIVFYPGDVAGGVRWSCDQGTIPSKYRPRNCQ